MKCGKGQRRSRDDLYQSIFLVKKNLNRQAALDPSSRGFLTTSQQTLRLQKDSMPRLMDEDCSATFKFLQPRLNELLRSKTAYFDG